jgi:hypothetical protein
MKRRAPVFVGGAVGLAAALVVIGYGTGNRAPRANPMLADYGGPIRAVVMQYARGSDFVAPVYRQYLGYQDTNFIAFMACPSAGDFQEITQLIGPVKCRLVPVYTNHEQTAWSRDRWVAVPARNPALPVTLLAPKGEYNAEVWPQRAGDAQMAEDLGRALPNEFCARRSGLLFDGGDFLADGANLFATRALWERNLEHTVRSREQLLQAIGQELGQVPVLLEEGPQHHAGMFMMAAGPDRDSPGTGPASQADNSNHRVMVVADPSLGKPLYNCVPEYEGAFLGGPDFSAGTQARFDYVAKVCGDLGYRVVRVPVVPTAKGKMYITYVNVIIDLTSDGKPVVYMSSFAGQEKLNAAGATVWESLGYEVRPIDCTSVWHLGGTLHCLVNVYRRES